jgi:hypothetical protein
MQQIRLACRFCDREDFDFVDELPPDWFSVDEVQGYEASLQEADLANTDVSPLDWFTHLGVCPSCYEVEIRPALTS